MEGHVSVASTRQYSTIMCITTYVTGKRIASDLNVRFEVHSNTCQTKAGQLKSARLWTIK